MLQGLCKAIQFISQHTAAVSTASNRKSNSTTDKVAQSDASVPNCGAGSILLVSRTDIWLDSCSLDAIEDIEHITRESFGYALDSNV